MINRGIEFGANIGRAIIEHPRAAVVSALGIPLAVIGGIYGYHRHTSGIDNPARFGINHEASEMAGDIIDGNFGNVETRTLVVRDQNSPAWRVADIEIGDNTLRYLSGVDFNSIQKNTYLRAGAEVSSKAPLIDAQDVKRERAKDVLGFGNVAPEDSDKSLVTIYFKIHGQDLKGSIVDGRLVIEEVEDLSNNSAINYSRKYEVKRLAPQLITRR